MGNWGRLDGGEERELGNVGWRGRMRGEGLGKVIGVG